MIEKVKPEQLYNSCFVESLDFDSTAQIKPQVGTIGQGRALKALDFGLSLPSKGFNIFMLGDNGTGKLTTIKALLKDLAKEEKVPDDWCYVYNFKEPDMPRAISLTPGKAIELQKDMEEAIKTLKVEIPRVFESKEYEKQRGAIFEEHQKKQKEYVGTLEEEAKEKGFSIRKTVSGLFIVPVTPNNEPLTEEEFEKLGAENKKAIEDTGRHLQEKLDDIVRGLRGEEKQMKERVAQLERDAALSAIGHYIEEIKAKYADYEKIQEYLVQVETDILDNLDDFKGGDDQPSPLPFMRPQKVEPSFSRYVVNVLVNNKDSEGAPCIFESNPTYYNLFGRIEHKFQYGVAVTDFTMIKPGSLHKANGGYIIIDALDLLRNLFAYDALKRSIRNREVKIDDIWEQYRQITTASLKPEAIELDVKVILIGTPYLYYTLYNLDEEYKELFKVKADFDSKMDRTAETIRKYAEFVASKCNDEKLMPFDRSGVARVVEYGSRLAGHQDWLSSRFSVIADLVRESHYWATKDGKKVVSCGHVEQALYERIYRSNRVEERLLEMMREDILIIETSGGRVGQVNGLAVLSLGDYTFGKASRITAKTFAGRAGVVNIERETKMSGKIHEKAILIISNYLGSKYAQRKPISLSASITFEQLYDMVEGDSATCAELYVLLSSLSGVPLRQDLAVTGSMDQNGDVQPIGGVNEKIEGFFDLCVMRGLEGSQGVIIPRRNFKNLMLKKDVVDAVNSGMFSIYLIDRMEEGLELLTGTPAGELNAQGEYPEGTINYLVAKRFADIALAMKPKKDSGEKDSAEKENGETEGAK